VLVFFFLNSSFWFFGIAELPGVRWVLPDSYLNVKEKDYGGKISCSVTWLFLCSFSTFEVWLFLTVCAFAI